MKTLLIYFALLASMASAHEPPSREWFDKAIREGDYGRAAVGRSTDGAPFLNLGDSYDGPIDYAIPELAVRAEQVDRNKRVYWSGREWLFNEDNGRVLVYRGSRWVPAMQCGRNGCSPRRWR